LLRNKRGESSNIYFEIIIHRFFNYLVKLFWRSWLAKY